MMYDKETLKAMLEMQIVLLNKALENDADVEIIKKIKKDIEELKNKINGKQ